MIRTALLATVLAFTLPYAQPWRTDAPPIQQAGTTVTACDLDPYATCTTTTESSWTPTSEPSPSSPVSDSPSSPSTDSVEPSTSTEPSPTTNDSSPISSEITAPPPPPSNGPCLSLTVPVETGGAATYQQGDCDLTVDVGTPTSGAESAAGSAGMPTVTASTTSTTAAATVTATTPSLAETGLPGFLIACLWGFLGLAVLGIGALIWARPKRGQH